jgi:CHAT domain-containing protein
VIASQWTADDRATALFMEHFYSLLTDTNPANAVRIAQQRVAAQWPHPYFWAPWIVVGNAEHVPISSSPPSPDVT